MGRSQRRLQTPMTTRSISPAMQAKAEALADQAHTWHRGRSKVDGAEFAIIPASDGMTAHWANRLGCTCVGHRRRGICTHQLACQILDQRANTAMVAAQDAERRARLVSVFDVMGDDGSETLDRAIARQREQVAA